MSSAYPYAESLRQALSASWSTVLPLDESEGRRPFAAFIDACVREEFAKKFREAFNGRWPLTLRFLHGPIEKGLGERIDEVFGGCAQLPLEAEVLWGSLEHPIAFSLRARAGPPRVSGLFVDEGDALARVSLAPGRDGFLLLTGAREQLFRFPKQLPGDEPR